MRGRLREGEIRRNGRGVELSWISRGFVSSPAAVEAQGRRTGDISPCRTVALDCPNVASKPVPSLRKGSGPVDASGRWLGRRANTPFVRLIGLNRDALAVAEEPG